MIDKVYIDGKVAFETNEAGAAFRWAHSTAAESGVECIVSLDGGAYGYRVSFLYEDDLQAAIAG